MVLHRLARMPRHPQPLPETAPPPPPAGPHAVQLLRTYGVRRPPFPFAPEGERSIARAYTKAFANARSMIYIEDQYMWSSEVAAGIAGALKENPGLNVIAVIPRYPDSDGFLGGPPKRAAQVRAIGIMRRAAPDRVGVFDLEIRAGTPIYVHAKICIIDDTWFTIGSDNFNRRSWTMDSELTCAVIDTGTPPPLAHGLRLQLWAEHLGLDPNDPRLRDPADGLKLWKGSADALDRWYEAGRDPNRPLGHVRHHIPETVPRLQRFWAEAANRFVVDPDGRPRGMRGTDRF